MPYCAENVCIEVDCSNNMYAIGSRSHVSFVDGRIANKTVGSIKSKDKECGEYTMLVSFHYLLIL